MQYLSFLEIVTKDRAEPPINQENFWSLNLDQIESNSGKVLLWHESTVDNLGPSTYFFTSGTVLYSKLRPYLNKVVLADRDGYATTELVPIKCNEKIAFPPYIAHFLRSPKFLKFAENLVAGAKMPRMVMSEFWKYKIPLPSITEQRRIATILDKAEALRSKRREAIAKLEQLLQSVFLEMFGDPVTNPKNWPIGNLTHLGALDRGISKHRPRGAPELLGGVHPLVQTGDVSRAGTYIKTYKSTYSDLGLAQSKKWPKGTLCITIAANIAETAILDFEACFPDSVVGFTSQKSGSIEYVCMLLSFLKKILDEKAPQVAQKNINLEILRNLPIPIPLQNDQIKWAGFFKKIENQKNQLLRSQDIFENLASSLQTQFFTQ